LALATLLDLNYEGTEIENAGLTRGASRELRNSLVRDFWRTFDGEYRGSIPPGIIFLPGEKVERIEGFGWAPLTWMSAHEVDFPDPLSRFAPTRLDLGGLAVHYPGFLLHTQNEKARRKVLGTDGLDSTFTFPVDRKLLEWYNATPADPESAVTFIDSILSAQLPLAIILSRPQPGESPREIALLVQIYKQTPNKVHGDDPAFNCQVIRRMHVWRETSSEYLTGPGRSGIPLELERGESIENITSSQKSSHWSIIAGSLVDEDNDFCIGEVIGPNQEWIVDGYNPTRYGLKKPMPRAPSRSNLLSERVDTTSLVSVDELGAEKPEAGVGFWNRLLGRKAQPQFSTRTNGQQKSEIGPGKLQSAKTDLHAFGSSRIASPSISRKSTAIF